MKWHLVRVSVNVCKFVVSLLALSITTVATAQTNYVLKTGDTMSGPLAIGVNQSEEPSIELFGDESNYKFIRFQNTSVGSLWDIAMEAESDSFSFWFHDGNNIWNCKLRIDANGVIYGNASGLTNLNVSVAIPDGTIPLTKLSEPALTDAVFTNGTIDSLSVGSLWGMPFAQDVGKSSMAVGGLNIASNFSFASGFGSEATGSYSHAVGESTKATGLGAHAEGGTTEASGRYSHAEGYYTKALGYPSHAEGYITKASGSVSHSEGHTTIASGLVSHAEGYLSEARATITHASGFSAIAEHDRTFVWSSSDDEQVAFSSTTNRQFSVYAENGIRLLTGPSGTVQISGQIVGDGSGLTGIQASQIDLSNIGIYGDISMGSFTNTTASN